MSTPSISKCRTATPPARSPLRIFRRLLLPALLCAFVFTSRPAAAQAVISGRISHPAWPRADEQIPMTAQMVFGTPRGDGQSSAARTWETAPAGWYRITGPAGNYTLLMSTPGGLMRPIVRNNVFVRDGETFDRLDTPAFDLAVMDARAWDTKPATDYYQLFTAKSASITQIGFRLAHDGIDGFGPGKQDLALSIVEPLADKDLTPDRWRQVGPEVVVPDVDAGGGKSYTFSAGFNSGEVKLTPGKTYAVHLRAQKAGNTFQAFWRDNTDVSTACYRIGPSGAAWQSHQLWLTIAGDRDGLLIPYNKRVQKQFASLTHFSPAWTQTYIAQGKSLAGVILYAATSGVQPSMSRQRVLVRVRKGGIDGPIIGIQKVAIGWCTYTGDAAWGAFAAAYAPAEVPLEPGALYALEFQTLETRETLHGFINAKKQVNDEKPGFNPYRKAPGDEYNLGSAYLNGKDEGYDLDMQVIEYQSAAPANPDAVAGPNLLANGDMQAGSFDEKDPANGAPASWAPFDIDPGALHQFIADLDHPKNHLARVLGGSATGKTVDGGWVQKIAGLSPKSSYRLMASIRCSWILDDKHQCMIGVDPTGQTADPAARTIVWTLAPRIHGQFMPQISAPFRVEKDAASIWLRARTSQKSDFPFKADFDDVRLQKVDEMPPDPARD